jgi:hypothetical protein
MMNQQITLNTVASFVRTRSTIAKLIVAATALLVLVTTIGAVTQGLEPSVQHVNVCVKDNGQLRMVVDDREPCGPSERLVDWVVGGEVTGVRAGQGLITSRDNGIVNLAVDPSILHGCASCGRIFAGFNDGPGDIFGAFGDQIVAQSTVANLSVPAGSFAIFAKLTVRNEDSIDEASHPVRCMLKAGADFDEAKVVVEDEQDSNDNGLPDRDGASSLVMNLMVVHHFDEPGNAALFCVDGTPANPAHGLPVDDGDVKYEDLKLVAIEASSISNVLFPGH